LDFIVECYLKESNMTKKNLNPDFKIYYLLYMIIPSLILAQGGKDYGQFAPADAWNEDSTLAYYGSENEWTRRMFTEERGHTQYKRRGQRQMLAIQEGHPELAVEYCKKRLLKDPNDSETLYMLTVAWSQLGEFDSAMVIMHKALDAGLPFERFLSGPRRLLKPLRESTPFIEYMGKHSVPVIHGPMIGAVTDTSARFWVRTLEEVQIGINIFKDYKGKLPIAYETGQTKADKDYTTVIEVKGLQANTEYYYDVLIACESYFEETYPSFRTYSTTVKPSAFKIAFGGGQVLRLIMNIFGIQLPNRNYQAFFFLVIMSILMFRKCRALYIIIPITGVNPNLNIVVLCNLHRYMPYGMIMIVQWMMFGWDHLKINRNGKYPHGNYSGTTGTIHPMVLKNGPAAGSISQSLM